MLDPHLCHGLAEIIALWPNGNTCFVIPPLLGLLRVWYIVTMVVVFTVMGLDFERHEPMPNLAACWQRAPERMEELRKAHPQITGISIGCAVNAGEPALG